MILTASVDMMTIKLELINEVKVIFLIVGHLKMLEVSVTAKCNRRRTIRITSTSLVSTCVCVSVFENII